MTALRISVALLFILSCHNVSRADNQLEVPFKAAVQDLTRRLENEVKAGRLTPSQLQIFTKASLEFQTMGVHSKMTNRVWDQKEFRDYTKDPLIQKACDFMDEHKTSFDEMESREGVDREIVAAILLVETEYGASKPKYRALDLLASLAAMATPSVRDKMIETVQANVANNATWKANADSLKIVWPERAEKVVAAPYFEELKVFLVLADLLGWDVDTKYSSWGGAIGYGQMLPSTAYRRMKQPDGSFWAANLWDWDDTIRLVGSELAKQGWKKGLSEQEQKTVVSTYNRWPPYVDQVTAVYRILWDSYAAVN